jgi:hypothetical protein
VVIGEERMVVGMKGVGGMGCEEETKPRKREKKTEMKYKRDDKGEKKNKPHL